MELMRVDTVEASWNNKGVRGYLPLQNVFLSGSLLRRRHITKTRVELLKRSQMRWLATSLGTLRLLQITWPEPQISLNMSLSRSLGKGSFPSKTLPPFPTNLLVLVFHGSLGFALILCGSPGKISLGCVLVYTAQQGLALEMAHTGLSQLSKRGNSHLFPTLWSTMAQWYWKIAVVGELTSWKMGKYLKFLSGLLKN